MKSFRKAFFVWEGVNLLNEDIGAEGEVLVSLSCVVRNPEMPTLCPGDLLLSSGVMRELCTRNQWDSEYQLKKLCQLPTHPCGTLLKSSIGHAV